MITDSFWITLVLSGLLGSLGHCLGMCGPLNMMVAAQIRKSELSLIPSFLVYHVVRILVYALLGSIVGALGSLLGLGQQFTTIGGVVSLFLGLAVLLLGVSYLGWFVAFSPDGASKWWNVALSHALHQGGSRGVALIGAVNGLLPCGLVYGALLLAASSGKAWSGALGMLVFGAGTIPTLFALDLGVGALSVRLRQGMLKVAGALMIIVGLQLILRGGASLHIWPHLRYREMVLW